MPDANSFRCLFSGWEEPHKKTKARAIGVPSIQE
ncbi:hypothetical protein SAMN05216229_105255 [Geopseudomonas sagittaria]|uniref:Uncharacterized protein n=1 Tax=Geopseudomonas sagittaria TaxID=1135990 RepID=A0A1I5T3Z9_9GAMM|nr:hypothetical protein SAMN05216229_105255 [Pseudomonas sagittaria]